MLNIQKTILLLKPEHFDEFKKFLENNGSLLSLKLVEHIHVCGTDQPDSDTLCNMVYGNAEEKSKKKFFQLAHHTFKLTSFLAKNYPFYLSHNLSYIGKMIHTGEKDQAGALARMLLELAEKVEDFNTQIGVLQFLSQEAFVLESNRQMLDYHQHLSIVLDATKTANDIYTYLRKELNFKDKRSISNPDIEHHLSYFRQFHQHQFFSIRIISKYGVAYTLSYLDDNEFYSTAVVDELEAMIKDLDKHCYVIFPFADDLQLKIDYLYLKHRMYYLPGEEIVRESMAMIKKWKDMQFWKGYINMSQLVALSVLGSHYATKYCVYYRDDFDGLIPADAQQKIQYLKTVCTQMLDQPKWESGFFVRYINLNNIYSMLLMLGTVEERKKAVRTIEGLLINYQQISFQRLYDSIFVTLILGYFALGDYSAVQDTYKRYEKLTANQVKIAENDLTIKAFYYIAQWISTERKQYLEKLSSVLLQTGEFKNLEQTRGIIEQAVEYYDVPLPVS